MRVGIGFEFVVALKCISGGWRNTTHFFTVELEKNRKKRSLFSSLLRKRFIFPRPEIVTWQVSCFSKSLLFPTKKNPKVICGSNCSRTKNKQQSLWRSHPQKKKRAARSKKVFPLHVSQIGLTGLLVNALCSFLFSVSSKLVYGLVPKPKQRFRKEGEILLSNKKDQQKKTMAYGTAAAAVRFRMHCRL